MGRFAPDWSGETVCSLRSRRDTETSSSRSQLQLPRSSVFGRLRSSQSVACEAHLNVKLVTRNDLWYTL